MLLLHQRNVITCNNCEHYGIRHGVCILRHFVIKNTSLATGRFLEINVGCRELTR
jgi:hypothetical protein